MTESVTLAKQADQRQNSRRRLRDMPLVQPVEGEVLDLAAGGLGLRTWDGLAVNAEYQFTFGPPQGRVRLRGRVIWCRLIPSSDDGYAHWLPPYRAGIEFVGIST